METPINREFLGIGWRFPLQVTPEGRIAQARYEQRIEESIVLILSTAPGERPMLPDFGCGIHDLVYAPNNLSTASLAAHFCIEALGKWEPRIEEIEAHAEPSEDEPNRLDINIKYKVRATNTSRNLVYPFYIRRSDS